MILGASGPGTDGSWEYCLNGTVVFGIKEKVAPEKKSALNAVKLRCSNYVDMTSSEGTEGDYSQLFIYCSKGFSHARIATNVRSFVCLRYLISGKSFLMVDTFLKVRDKFNVFNS